MTAAGEGFVHLRVRSAYSLLEGAIKADAIGALAASGAMPAVALTDRANLFGALEFSVVTSKAGVQPIIGCALPVSGIGQGPPERWARIATIVLLAQNAAGWRHLCELSSAAFLDAPASDCPHVAWSEVASRAEGLILLSGGADGPVDPLFAAGRANEGRAALAEMKRVFGGRLYVEIQRHGLASQAAAEPGLIAWADDEDVPLVATNDAHFARAETWRAHAALLCIASGAFVDQEDRRRITPEHWFKPAADMRILFADLPEACDNTLQIARRRRQAAPPAGGEDAYWARLEREIGVIQSMGFSGYFLIVSDFMKWAVAHDIPVGPGRGSGAGSVVAWSLLITGIDPLRFGLLFERFLNPERISMPDFDIDFCQERREEVIAYVQERYGRDRVAQIITFGTLQARAVLRDVGRVMQLPLGQVDRLAKMIPNNPANPVSLARAIELEPRLQAGLHF